MKNNAKKRSCCVLCALLAFCAFALPAGAALLPGDVDGDGGYTANDARLALRAAVKLENLNDEQSAAADVDNSGTVTAADARVILRASVKLAELNADGTAFVDVLTPGELLADFLMKQGTYFDEGFYAYGYVDRNDFYDLFVYMPGAEYPFSVEHHDDLVKGFDCAIFFNETFSEYVASAVLYDDEWIYMAATYEVDHERLSLNTPLQWYRITSFEGDPSVKDDVSYAASASATTGLQMLLEDLQKAGVKVTKEDMHLYHIYDVQTQP